MSTDGNVHVICMGNLERVFSQENTSEDPQKFIFSI